MEVLTRRTRYKSGKVQHLRVIRINPELSVVVDGENTTEQTAVACVALGDWSDLNLTLVSAYFKYSLPTCTFVSKLRGILELKEYKNVMVCADTRLNGTMVAKRIPEAG